MPSLRADARDVPVLRAGIARAHADRVEACSGAVQCIEAQPARGGRHLGLDGAPFATIEDQAHHPDGDRTCAGAAARHGGIQDGLEDVLSMQPRVHQSHLAGDGAAASASQHRGTAQGIAGLGDGNRAKSRSAPACASDQLVSERTGFLLSHVTASTSVRTIPESAGAHEDQDQPKAGVGGFAQQYCQHQAHHHMRHGAHMSRRLGGRAQDRTQFQICWPFVPDDEGFVHHPHGRCVADERSGRGAGRCGCRAVLQGWR
mmetsp:Transcript_27965/g.78351  ORF Transcript_27965/g.78351 Transcript_27965/m.78351 type:complete len:259 (+) Transcript_27965:319-1095(+)